MVHFIVQDVPTIIYPLNEYIGKTKHPKQLQIAINTKKKWRSLTTAFYSVIQLDLVITWWMLLRGSFAIPLGIQVHTNWSEIVKKLISLIWSEQGAYPVILCRKSLAVVFNSNERIEVCFNMYNNFKHVTTQYLKTF